MVMIDALERVSRGETKRLLLLLPPGSAKSTYSSLLFPAWWFAQHPASAVITACHTASLAEHFGRGVRGLIEEHEGLLNVRVRPDARAAHRFMTEQGGEYFSIGVNGAVTGRRADLAIIDDPVSSFADAESFAGRERLWNWFRSELVTRLKPQGCMVVVMTRWHVDDLAGRLIEQGGWEVVRLPAIAEAEDCIGRAPGDALWPEWEDLDSLLTKQRMLGDRAFSAMFQQAPVVNGGQLFDTRRIEIVGAVGAGTAVRAWDLAATIGDTGDPDWTVGLKLVREGDGKFTVDDIVRMQAGPGEVERTIRACAEADGRQVLVGLPQDPGQSGKFQTGVLIATLAGFRAVATRETGNKAARAGPVASQAAYGNLRIRRAAWNAAFLDELSCFPHGRKDDQVDALSHAFALLTEVAPPARFANVPIFAR
jgi:predicted phage terminase large subunit-like protein